MESEDILENIEGKTIGNDLEFIDSSFRISSLEASNQNLVFINQNAELEEATSVMLLNNFSQLPVTQNGKRGLKGVISWRSIGQKHSLGEKSTNVLNLMEDDPQIISASKSLFKAIPIIIEHDYILIKNKSEEICGIITASDLSLHFKQLTEPFLLVAEIEHHVRQILRPLKREVLERAKDEMDRTRVIEKIEDLTFGEYQRIFDLPENWQNLNLSFDKKVFCERFEKIRDIRNKIMHFDSIGLKSESIATLRNFLQLLQKLRTIKVS